MTQYFVDTNGAYIGAFDGNGVAVPTGAVEVPNPPIDGLQTWDGKQWSAIPVTYPDITARQLRLALLSIGVQEADVDMKLVNDPAGMVEWKYASSYKKSHPLIAGLSASFGLPTEQVNSLWLWAQDL